MAMVLAGLALLAGGVGGTILGASIAKPGEQVNVASGGNYNKTTSGSGTTDFLGGIGQLLPLLLIVMMMRK